MRKLAIDEAYLMDTLLGLLAIPSPSGYTDLVVHHVSEELVRLGIELELTRRGAVRATLPGEQPAPGRAIVAHLDTLGAMVKHLKSSGRLEIVPIGTWSSRFAEGARVTIFTDAGAMSGTIVPLKASGHIYHDEIDTQPVAWTNVEVRVDERCNSLDDLHRLGFHVGDYVAIRPDPQVTETGYICSRFLDDKAGVACLLAAAKAVKAAGVTLPVNCHLLLTISEEVGSGASAVLHGDVAEMVAVDNSTAGPGQASSEFGVTVVVKDMSGPFDYHLTHKLIGLCDEYGIECSRDLFIHYRNDAASAVEAGNDIRTALACFGVDASHGYERSHIDSLRATAELMALYMQSPLTFKRDRQDLGPLKGFPTQPGDEALYAG